MEVNTPSSESDAQYLSLAEMFEDRWFEIPPYQRGYSWGEKQVKDLLKDIEQVLENDHDHFCGTVVAVNAHENGRHYVVDGQQRLTSLILIMNTLARRLSIHREEIESRYIKARLPDDSEEALKLTPNKEVRDFYEGYILKGLDRTPEYASHERLKRANEAIEKWLEEKVSYSPEAIWKAVPARMNFIFFTPKQSGEEGLMFEVINNRGKPLSQLEKVKNYLMYFVTANGKQNLRSKIVERWPKVLKNLNDAGIDGREAENSFLRYCHIVFFDPTKSRSWNVHEELKEAMPVHEGGKPEHEENIEKFLEFLVQASRRYAELFTTETPNLDDADRREKQALVYLRAHPGHGSIIPLYLAIMEKTQGEERCRLLELLEKLNFRVYVLPEVTKRNDSGQGEIFRMAHDFYNEQGDTPTAEVLEDKLRSFIRANCPRRKFVQALTLDEDETYDYYDWQGNRYFLARFEEAKREKTTFPVEQVLKTRASGRSNDYLSIEHIWAQNDMSKDYGPRHMEKRRLGNLALLGFGFNAEQSNDPIREKMRRIDEKYKEALRQVQELPQMFREVRTWVEEHGKLGGWSNWTNRRRMQESRRLNDLRETELVEFALQTWAVEGDHGKFEGVDSFAREDENEKYIFSNAKGAAA